MLHVAPKELRCRLGQIELYSHFDHCVCLVDVVVFFLAPIHSCWIVTYLGNLGIPDLCQL